MDETRRRSYLNAMGIQLWHPRIDLPNARPSPVCRLVQPVGEVKDRDPGEQANVAIKSRVEFSAVLPDNPAVRGDGRAGPVVVQEVAPFKLCLFYADPGSCLAFDVPLQTVQLDARRLRLVEDISRALGSDNQKSTIVFQQWPMIQNRDVPQPEEDARLVIQRKLKQLIGQTSTKLLIMGKVAARYLPIAVGTVDHGENPPAVGIDNTVTAVVPGIDELLQAPLEKKRVWAALESLTKPEVHDG
jgi:hypothetical protein